MKKILITGGSGFLGNFFRTNLKKNYTLQTIGRSNKNDFKINLLDKKKLSYFFKKNKFDYILHCAGYVPGKGNLLKNKHFIYNHEMTKNIIEYSNSKIIFFSTYKVYKKQTRVGFPFKITCSKITDYASSKILSENLIVKKNQEYLILRLPTIFGEGVRNGLLFKTIKHNYINNKINENWCVLDVNRILQPITMFLEKKLSKGIYNLNYSVDYSFDIILNKVFKILGNKTKLLPKKKFFLHSSVFNLSENDLKKDLIKYAKDILNQ